MNLLALVALVLGLIFLFEGEPDVWDALHQRAISSAQKDGAAKP